MKKSTESLGGRSRLDLSVSKTTEILKKVVLKKVPCSSSSSFEDQTCFILKACINATQKRSVKQKAIYTQRKKSLLSS